ncbi:MAG TPA: DUF86 domain-containing protein [Thermodesulfovibrionales bacterium]|nr:DUF86 domain-containing protein [Thermodesulfovibrionales bacterium]
MRSVPLNRETLLARLSFIEASIRSLRRFEGMSFQKFHADPDNFRIAFYDLQRALEAIMDIGTHILSRIPGARATSYKDIPLLLGKNKIVAVSFAEKKLLQMAGYRNRMVHFYSEITEKELFNIIQDDLEDFERFCAYIDRVISNPAKYGLDIE